jgi:hypothetical protein
MKTEILKIKGDWTEVLNDCRATVKKEELNKEPSEKFKKAILKSEHEPIRSIEIKFRWRDIPYWVAMHWKTHIWRSRVDSQRNDRQDRYDRGKAPQDSPVTLTGEINSQHAIDTARKRLCFMASPETRELMEDFKYKVHEEVDEYIADAMQKNCVYRCGCPEQNPCGWFNHFVERHPEVNWLDIDSRYEAANKEFYEKMEKRNG